MIMDWIQWIRARLEGSPVSVPLPASRGLPSSAVDLRAPSARWGLLGCVGDGSAVGHRRWISDAPILAAWASGHAAARAAVMVNGSEKRPEPLPRHGQWSRIRMWVRHVVGDGSASGHRRRYGSAPRLAVLADSPAAARAVVFLIRIRPRQLPRRGQWSCGRRGALRDRGDGSSPAHRRRHPVVRAPCIGPSPARPIPANRSILLGMAPRGEGCALGDRGGQRLERGLAEGLGSSLAGPPIVRGRGRVHCMQHAILSVHAAWS